MLSFYSPFQDPETAEMIRKLDTKKNIAVKGIVLHYSLVPVANHMYIIHVCCRVAFLPVCTGLSTCTCMLVAISVCPLGIVAPLVIS